MGTDHLETWRLWLVSIAHFNGTEAELDNLAEALNIASPNGPSGFACVDKCRCAETPARAAALLYAELVQSGLKMPEADQALIALRDALKSDNVRTTDSLIHSLAEYNIIVSYRNGYVAHARNAYPDTWAVIERWRN